MEERDIKIKFDGNTQALLWVAGFLIFGGLVLMLVGPFQGLDLNEAGDFGSPIRRNNKSQDRKL